MGKPDPTPPTLEQQVTEHLTRQILEQHLGPGEHIVAENLARALGVSRLPVREALRNLAGNGLVELRPHRGAFVTTIDIEQPDKLVELVEVRGLLEPRAAGWAAERRDDLDVAGLDGILALGADAVRQRDRPGAGLAHHRFLRTIAGMTRRERLDSVLAPLHHRTLLAFATVAMKVHPDGWEAHRRVRDAIANRDADAAATLTAEHLEDVLTALRTPGNLVPAVIGSRLRGRGGTHPGLRHRRGA